VGRRLQVNPRPICGDRRVGRHTRCAVPTMNICTGCSCIARPPERRRSWRGGTVRPRNLPLSEFSAAYAHRARALIGLCAWIPTPGMRTGVREQARSFRRAGRRTVAAAWRGASGAWCDVVRRVSRFRGGGTGIRASVGIDTGSAEVQRDSRRVLPRPCQRARDCDRCSAPRSRLDPAGFRAHLTLAEAYYHDQTL